MAKDLASSEVLALLSGGADELKAKQFEVLRALCTTVSSCSDDDEGSADLLLRATSRRAEFGASARVIDGLLARRGLFPYIEDDKISERDFLARELQRPTGLEDVVLHRVQTKVYNLLVRKRSVVLSAPTSFGKSVLIDAIIASGVYSNILVIVPTLALIDETRRRLSERFRPRGWQILTHQSQRPGDRNVYVLTAERVAEFGQMTTLDFFVLDEFYKLSPGIDDERSSVLNQALYRLLSRKIPFYMLGPSIQDVPQQLKSRCEFIKSDFKTVTSEIRQVPGNGNELPRLTELLRQLKEPTLIYCKSPERVRAVVQAMLHGRIASTPSAKVSAAADWIGKTFHPQWSLVSAMRAGIGVHHGKLPRSLGQYQIKLFNEGHLRFLVCTSTLIEGVNTRAKNIVVLDDTLAKRKYDFFTFNNIKGRAGRMFQHFVGHVYLFHPQPQPELPLLDIPAVTLGNSATDSLLLQADIRDVSSASRGRLTRFASQSTLSMQTLKLNASIDPGAQLSAASALTKSLAQYHPLLSWSGFPTWIQRKAFCEFLWEHFIKRGSAGVFSGSQLAVRLGHLQPGRGSSDDAITHMIRHDLSQAAKGKLPSPDDAVESVLEFVKTWATFKFPTLSFAMDRIQKEVFGRNRVTTGDYSVYAMKVQSLFSDPVCVALEEYGVPFQLAKRLESSIASSDLDQSLEKFRALRRSFSDPFEQEVIADAQKYM